MGSPVTPAEYATWSPIGAVATQSGYDVAWKSSVTGTYQVWTVNSSGAYTGTLLPNGGSSGSSAALEQLETTFGQDLNGDGTIGPSQTVISSNGAISLVEVGNQYYIDNISGSQIALNYQSSPIVDGQAGAWNPVAAVQTTTGYEVAWNMTGTNEDTVVNFDSNGNLVSDTVGIVSGTSQAITITRGASQELAGADTGSVTFNASTGKLILDSSSLFMGQINGFTGNGRLSGSDQIDLKDINFSSVSDSFSNGVLTITDGTDTAHLDFNGSYVLANFKLASDGNGGTTVYDPPVTSSASTTGATPPTQGTSSGSLPDGNYNSRPSGFAGATDSTIALLTHFMASSFPPPSATSTGTVLGEGASQSASQQLLTNSRHA